MGGKKSLLVDKNRMPLAIGVAFVAFTTQFGGGFASGAQIYATLSTTVFGACFCRSLPSFYTRCSSGTACVTHTVISFMTTAAFPTSFMASIATCFQISLRLLILL